jgi:pyrimidine-nucleoside phosphorylase
MDILKILTKKKDGEELSKEEIEFFIQGYTNDEITDYQAAALIMAICINGMTADEILALTIAMANSGETLDLTEISSDIVDKHSTGGIGDKVTIILAPIIASLGVPVAKMSGRGLGITGGTADKLESIPGYNVNLSIEEFKKNVKEIGISLITQTLNLAPADKKIYALRDTIACTKSVPLIASSIMSKKIAAGANHIVLDVTCGSGAFMKTKAEAKNLSKMMNSIGDWAKKETKCIITSMDEPLGYSVGNTLEVIEAIKFLKGEMPEDVKEVILTLGAYMIKAAKKGDNIQENKEKMLEAVKSGKALEKFKELVEHQGGDTSYIDDTNKFEKAPFIMPVLAIEDGFVEKLDAKIIGEITLELGAGRKTKEDKIDYRVGITLQKKVADEVKTGDVLAYIHAADSDKATEAVEELQKAYKIVDKKVKKPDVILEIM